MLSHKLQIIFYSLIAFGMALFLWASSPPPFDWLQGFAFVFLIVSLVWINVVHHRSRRAAEGKASPSYKSKA